MLVISNSVVDIMLVIGNNVVDILPVIVNSVVDPMRVSGDSVVDITLVLSRIFTCLRALIFGEDFSSDPVSRVFGLIVHKSSGGQVQVDTAILSQVWPLASLQLVTVMQVTGLLSTLLCCKHSACRWNWHCHVGMPVGPSGKRHPALILQHLSDMLWCVMVTTGFCQSTVITIDKAGADKPKQSTASYSSNNRDRVVTAVCDASFHWSHQCHLVKRFLEKYTEGEQCLSLENSMLGSGKNQRATC